MRRWWILLLALWLLAPAAGAVDVEAAQAEQLGVDSLEEALTGEAAELMSDVSPSNPGSLGDGLSGIVSRALPRIAPLVQAGLRTAVSLMAVVILCSMVTQMETRFSKNAVLLAGTLAITLLSVGNLRTMVGLGRDTLQELQAFTGLLVPVLASATAASGGVTTATVLQVSTVFLSNVLMSLMNRLLIPILYAFIALSAANAVLGNQTLTRLRDLGKWILTNGLKLVVFLFTGYLGISGVIAGAGDAAAVKAAKLAVSSVVPVVGGMISDASETVLAAAGVLRSAAGVFGMLAVVAICLLPLLRLAIQNVLLRLTAALCSTVGEKPLVDLLESVSDAMGFLMGMTGACGFMLLISCVCAVKAVTP